MPRFASPYIHDILAAYHASSHSARRAVDNLQRSFPRLATESEARFHSLAHSTVSSWFGQDHKLLPQFQAVLDQGRDAAKRGHGFSRLLDSHPEEEAEVKRVLGKMRNDAGAVINLRIIRWVMRAVLERKDPSILTQLTLSQGFLSTWAREQMGWTWRCRTGAASKLPIDWHAQGNKMAQRIAANMEIYEVHPSLVVNMDQTGVHLVPVDNHTYEARGSKDVKVIGAEDKRQITACVASSLDGDLLPLQLIFTGSTAKCLPPSTPAAIAASVHITHSDNHWSSQETMQQWIKEVLVPYANLRIMQHALPADSKIILVLDVWAVHKSIEFRTFLRTHHPNVQLVFVPANCTSKLQVADVMLQRPFKHGIKQKFNEWAAGKIAEQIATNSIIGLAPFLKMASIKPLILQWCIDSWTRMREGRDLIKFGWHTCCVSLFDVYDKQKRKEAVAACAKGDLEVRGFVPADSESDAEAPSSDSESDEDKDVLDVMQQRKFGSRRSIRKRSRVQKFGGGINPCQIDMVESGVDSGADGM